MHILYLSDPGGGLETNVRILGRALGKAGHRVSLLYFRSAGGNEQDTADEDGFQVYYVAMGDAHYKVHRALGGRSSLPLVIRSVEGANAIARKIREIHRAEPLDLVELPEVVLPWQKLVVPYVVRLHSAGWTWRMMLGESAGWADGVEKRMEGATLRRAGAVTAPSRAVAEIVRRECGVTRSIEFIPYPVDTERFRPAETRPNGKRVLFVGRVEARKGADVLLRAAEGVLARHPDAEFCFAGRVNEELTELIEGAPSQANFLGVVPHDELPALYRTAAVVVCPSQWDNSPNVIYEAMASGVPVVATRVGGIPELVEDGVTGILVQVGNVDELAGALSGLLGDAPRRARMGACGREKAVQEYRVEKVLERTMELYKGVVRA